MNIALIYGGRSGEHEISLISASSIARGMSKKDNVVLIGITKQGKWYLQDNSEYERIRKDKGATLQIKEDESKVPDKDASNDRLPNKLPNTGEFLIGFVIFGFIFVGIIARKKAKKNNF